jgi:Domain of unknown function (DUF4394)
MSTPNQSSLSRWLRGTTSVLLAAVVLAGCAWRSATAPASDWSGGLLPGNEIAWAITDSNRLIRFAAREPGRLLSSTPLTGLPVGESVVGMDFRVKNNQLYALGRSGRLYTIDTERSAARSVGTAAGAALEGRSFGFDFNPTVDRIRVVSDTGLNLRLHPDTGAQIDGDVDKPGVQPDRSLAIAPGDPAHGRSPSVVGAAYSYNKFDPKITTNYAIDAAWGSLLVQGSVEGLQPVVSPNTGLLRTVGSLGVGTFSHAAFDIDVISDRAFAVLHSLGARNSRWVAIDLATGRGRMIGEIGGAEPVVAMALEPQ